MASPLSAEPYPDVVSTSHYVPVRDGTRLAMSVYRPAVNSKAVDKPLPVIFVFTPYRGRSKDADGKVTETALSDNLGLRSLLRAGYVVAVADIRGKGASFGHRRGFQDRTEALDGRDLVEWLAKQPYSDGSVGMVGCSYLGGAAFQVATTAPPSLKAAFIGASDLDKYAFVRNGGITAQFNTRPDEEPEVDLATVPMDEDRDGSMLKAAVAEHAANTPMGPLWYAMPYRDSMSAFTGTKFWEEVGPYTYLDTVKRAGIATYFWGNWRDEPTSQVILSAANLGSRFLAGPGSHCVPARRLRPAGRDRPLLRPLPQAPRPRLRQIAPRDLLGRRTERDRCLRHFERAARRSLASAALVPLARRLRRANRWRARAPAPSRSTTICPRPSTSPSGRGR